MLDNGKLWGRRPAGRRGDARIARATSLIKCTPWALGNGIDHFDARATTTARAPFGRGAVARPTASRSILMLCVPQGGRSVG